MIVPLLDRQYCRLSKLIEEVETARECSQTLTKQRAVTAMSFMMEIEASRPSPLDQLVADYPAQKLAHHPTLDFCRQLFGVPDEDEDVAQRLQVKISKVRGWRELGRRTTPRSCL
jgi:hypothetical protein